MKENLLAQRYVRAAVGAISPDQFKSISDEAYALKQYFSRERKMLYWLSSPIISTPQKILFFQTIAEITSNQDFWNKIFEVLVQKKRCPILLTFLRELDFLLINLMQETHVDLVLAFPHERAFEEKIKVKIEEILGTKVVCDARVDEEIIGGFIAMTSNKIIDASLRTQLQKFVFGSTEK